MKDVTETAIRMACAIADIDDLGNAMGLTAAALAEAQEHIVAARWYETRAPNPPLPSATEAEARLRLGELGRWGYADASLRRIWFAFGDLRFELAESPDPIPNPAGVPYVPGNNPKLAIAVRAAALLGYGSDAPEGRIFVIKMLRQQLLFAEGPG